MANGKKISCISATVVFFILISLNTVAQQITTHKYLQLKSLVFDPIDEPALCLSPTDGAGGFYIVQFYNSPAKGGLKRLIKLGVRIYDYIPDDALLVFIDTEDTARKIYNLTNVRAICRYMPRWRIDPAIYTVSDSPVTIRVSVFKGSDPYLFTKQLREKIHGFNYEIIHIQRSDISEGTIYIRVDREDAVDISLSIAEKLEQTYWIDIFRVPVLYNNDSAWIIQSGKIESTPIWDAGIVGTGQIYSAADSGLDTDACQFRYSSDPDAQTLAEFIQAPNVGTLHTDKKVIAYYLEPYAEAYDDASGDFHGTHTTGNAAGDNYSHLASPDDPGHDNEDGMAPGAQIVFQDIGNHAGELYGIVVGLANLLQQAYDSGARVHNDSFGSQNPTVTYDRESRDADLAIWSFQDLVVTFAAGNSGPAPKTLGGTGSTAKNTICVGATASQVYGGYDNLAIFSSIGPTADGRIKPDIVSPGLVYSATETDWNDEGCCDIFGNPKASSKTDPPNNQCAVDDRYPTPGTSFSSPIIAGAALLVRDYFESGYYPTGERGTGESFDPTSALVKAVLINSAQPLTGGVFDFYRGRVIRSVNPAPSYDQGWGRVILEKSLYLKGSSRKLAVLNDSLNGQLEPVNNFPFGGIKEGEMHVYTIDGVKKSEVLKITLVWNDPPASLAAAKSLVNDLDLVVISPSGTFYRGNVNFQDGFTQPATDEDSTDQLNNVESVIIESPEEGDYIVMVEGSHVPGTGISSDIDPTIQGYALVATGVFEGHETVEAGAPEFDSIDPSSVVQGTVVDKMTIKGSNFMPGIYVDLGSGVSIGSINRVDSETIELKKVVISESISSGYRNIVLLNLDRFETVVHDALYVAKAVIPSGKESKKGCGGCNTSENNLSQSILALFLLFVYQMVLRLKKRRIKDDVV